MARVLLRSPKARAVIKAVADVLHARNRIEREEVDALCSAAYGDPFAYDRWAEAWPPTAEQIRGGILPAESARRRDADRQANPRGARA